MAAEEQVLVVERSVMEAVGVFQGLSFDVDRYLSRIFAPGAPRFMARSKAESDPAFKQIIPYVIVSCGDKYLSYVRGRQAGEKRLVGHRSIGIGGHINPVDDLPLFHDFRETYRAAVGREVAEEVSIESPHTDRVAALLNDDSTEVGRVHLGVVHIWRLERPEVRRAEPVISQLGFLTAHELRAVREDMESWSRFCVDQLDQLIYAAQGTGRAGYASG